MVLAEALIELCDRNELAAHGAIPKRLYAGKRALACPHSDALGWRRAPQARCDRTARSALRRAPWQRGPRLCAERRPRSVHARRRRRRVTLSLTDRRAALRQGVCAGLRNRLRAVASPARAGLARARRPALRALAITALRPLGGIGARP